MLNVHPVSEMKTVQFLAVTTRRGIVVCSGTESILSPTETVEKYSMQITANGEFQVTERFSKFSPKIC